MRAWWIGHSAPKVRKATPEMIEQAQRSWERRANRAIRQQGKDRQYHKNGLNGPRAVARRRRQISRGVLDLGTKA